MAAELWRKLRRPPAAGGGNSDFQSAEIDWSKDSLEEPTVESALVAARTSKRPLVLWGSAFHYGNGVIVQANLSVFKGTSFIGRWLIHARDGDVDVSLPEDQYTFSPLILTDDDTARFSQGQIRVCVGKQRFCNGPPLLDKTFKAIRQEGNYALIQQGSTTGWVYIPDLSESKDEVLNFTRGIIAYCRGDLEWADEFFTNAMKSGEDQIIKFDAALLAGVSRTRKGKDGTDLLRSALELNPYSRYAAQALIMSDIVLVSES